MSKTPVPLFRGDSRDGIALPDPAATTKLVAHILYLGGTGRVTPFTSTSDSREAADFFARRGGHVWTTDSERVVQEGAARYAHEDLLNNLVGTGKGKCKWEDAFEVAQARAYVKKWREHLLDWSNVEPASIAARIQRTFS